MRILKIMVLALFLGVLLAVPLSSCASESESETTGDQVFTVQRGDLTVDITAAGNLTLSHATDLIFNMTGTVAEVLVEEGDTVAAGDVLARLDTSEWEDQIGDMEKQVIQAQINAINAEIALKVIEDIWLDTAYAGKNVQQIQYRLEWVLENTSDDTEGILELNRALDDAWDDFLKIASNSDAAKDVEAREMSLELAEINLTEAQEALEEALDESPEIVAPSNGFITQVNVEGGDEVTKGTVVVTVADPDNFEANIWVNEMDILQLKLGSEAWVAVDALSGLSLPAEVTHISPTASISQGVVNYVVTVEVLSLEVVIKERQKVSSEISTGELRERIKESIEEGLITQEKAEEMMKQIQKEQGTKQGQLSNAISEDFQLREGLTVTVTVIVTERTNVLLVPNSAITPQRGPTYVQVVAADGTIEAREIETGISNWQYTEVTGGLSEGEQVLVSQGTITSTTTTQEESGKGMIPKIRK
ncbi:efflux RND transporter periplasmic adaptor subunit [Chloroflexota bacterium]